MECTTIKSYDEDNNPVYIFKKKFDTLDHAIKNAKIFNSKESQIYKLIAYKCPTCFKFHVGRGKKEVTSKERKKYIKDLKNDKRR